ncbi:MAG: orotidine-5'-phosphate decarboxylase, partial [Bacteroidia bacterium]
MTPSQLHQQILKKRSFLCVGLDTDPARIPAHLQQEVDPIFAFNKAIIDATQEFAVAYKPNIAFYEALGAAGWESLRKTIDYIPEECLIIADAKRGDIGNTAERYAKAFFGELGANAITIAPYMGSDAVRPFLAWENCWTFALALTSNPGAQDLQYHGEPPLYMRVIEQAAAWAEGQPGHLGFVVGATRTDSLAAIRAAAPEAFFLVPGVGAQGGDLEAVCRHGRNDLGGLLINSSRGIIYAGSDEHFADAAHEAAKT